MENNIPDIPGSEVDPEIDTVLHKNSLSAIIGHLQMIAKSPAGFIYIDPDHPPSLLFMQDYVGVKSGDSMRSNKTEFYANKLFANGLSSTESDALSLTIKMKGFGDCVVEFDTLKLYICTYLFSELIYWRCIRLTVKSIRDVPAFLVSFLYVLDMTVLFTQFPNIEKSVTDPAIVNPSDYFVMHRLSSVFFDIGNILLNHEKYIELTSEVMFNALLLLLADVLFMSEETQKLAQTAASVNKLFRIQLLKQKNILSDIVLSLTSRSEAKPTMPDLIATDVMHAIKHMLNTFPTNAYKDEFINPFAVSNEHVNKYIGITRMHIIDPVKEKSIFDNNNNNNNNEEEEKEEEMLGRQILETLLEISSSGTDYSKELIKNRMALLDASIPVDVSHQSKRQKKNNSNNNSKHIAKFDDYYALTVKQTIHQTSSTKQCNVQLKALIEKHEPSLIQNDAKLAFTKCDIIPMVKSTLATHIVFRNSIALSMPGEIDENEGHVCMLYGYLAKAFMSECVATKATLWKDVVAYLVYIYTKNVKIAKAALDMFYTRSSSLPDCQDNEFMHLFFLEVMEIIHGIFFKNEDTLSHCPENRIESLLKLMLLLTPGFYARVQDPAVVVDVAGLTNTLKKMKEIVAKDVGEETCFKCFKAVVSQEGSDETIGAIVIINSIIGYVKTSKNLPVAAKFMFDVLDLFELSINKFNTVDSIVVIAAPPPSTSNANLILAMDINSIPLVYTSEHQIQDAVLFSTESSSSYMVKYPYEFTSTDTFKTNNKDNITRISAFATILSYIEYDHKQLYFRDHNNNNVKYDPFHKFWFDHIHNKSISYKMILKAFTERCSYPVFRWYNNTTRVPLCISANYGYRYTDLIMHNEAHICLTTKHGAFNMASSFNKHMANMNHDIEYKFDQYYLRKKYSI